MDDFMDFVARIATLAAIAFLSTSLPRLINPACGYEILISVAGGFASCWFLSISKAR